MILAIRYFLYVEQIKRDEVFFSNCLPYKDYLLATQLFLLFDYFISLFSLFFFFFYYFSRIEFSFSFLQRRFRESAAARLCGYSVKNYDFPFDLFIPLSRSDECSRYVLVQYSIVRYRTVQKSALLYSTV